jgi:hypothetical protein
MGDANFLASRHAPPSRLSWLLPMVAVAVFAGLYALAAFLYPGGSSAKPERHGYSFFENYWCDLLNATTVSGRSNPARPVGLVAMLSLSAGITVFWWNVPRLFTQARARAAFVRTAGIGSGVVTPFVATRAHDSVIHVAGLLAVAGFVSTATALGRRGGRALAVLSWTTLWAALANYSIWETRIGLAAMAVVQKVAFALFLSWIVVVANHLRKAVARLP